MGGEKFFLSIGECSMGIYILHFWLLIYMLSSTSFRVFGIARLMEFCPWATMAAVVVATVAITYAITRFVRKCKIGRLLMG